MAESYAVGDLVTIPSEEGGKQVAVVSRTIDTTSAGHVLTVSKDSVVGRTVSIADVEAVDQNVEGFTQLAYRLNTLSSKVIEQRLLVYGPDR